MAAQEISTISTHDVQEGAAISYAEISTISTRDVQEGAAISYAVRPSKHDNGVYVVTAVAVMAAYGLLLTISIRYIKIVVIPAIIVVFVGTLWGKFRVKARLQHDDNDTANLGNDTDKAQRLLPMVVLSYCLQLMQLDLTLLSDKTNGQRNGDFAISHFLLFFSSALGALAMMMATLQIRTSPGVAQARQVLHRAFTVLLAITVHTMATEWVEEDMVLVCMPELIAVLVWFTSYFDHARRTASIDRVTPCKSSAILLRYAVAMSLVAYLVFMFASEKVSLFDMNYVLVKYWHTRALCSCTLSGVISYFSVWMIHQWPASTDSAKVPIQLLRFCGKICFGISVSMVPVQLYLFWDTLALSATILTAALRGLDESGELFNAEVMYVWILVLNISVIYRSALYRALKAIKFQVPTGTGRIKFLLMLSCLLVMLVQCLMLNVVMRYPYVANPPQE